ncbi:acyltransferase family protein [Bradyrhizobium genosp. A]|uniref:acyltransferase family protein n=1 Tax=Bradyrhizobium genosp. A TaxID=83626 RepID=UPI003CE89CBD
MKTIPTKRTFETMNGLRGLAAFLVVVWHGGHNWYGELVPPSSYLAVDLFFVLSGFVVAYSYEQRLASGLTASRFMITRLIRLYPLYILGTIISASTILAWSVLHQKFGPNLSTTISSLFFSATMLPTPEFLGKQSPADLYPLNVPAWSLLCEIIVNAVYALSYRWWSARNILILMIASACLMLLSNGWFDPGLGWGSGGFNWATSPFGFLRVFYSFPAGVLIYRILCRSEFSAPPGWSILIFAVLPLLFLGRSDLFCKLVLFLGFPLLVMLGSIFEPRGLLRRFCALVGGISYAVYAIHYPLLGIALLVQSRLGLDLESKYIGALFLIVIAVVASAADRWFDGPVRARLTNRQNRS